MKAAPQIKAMGAGLAVIGNGSVEALGAFANRYQDTVNIYTDPSLKAYEALGMLYGMGSIFSVKMLGHAVRASRGGHRQGKTQGNPLQQGGVCIFDQGGNLRYAHRDSTAGDHMHPDRIVEILGR